MNLIKIHSISKKILVALVGGFLLVFLLFHMTANLFVLRHDDGLWYSVFCHFMGTNLLVKIMEVFLLCFIALHILLTVWLAVTNRMAGVSSADNSFFSRRYHQRSRTKTHPGSKLMIWTGVLILACIAIHFYDFYFVKTGLVKGEYMMKVENLTKMDENAMADEELNAIFLRAFDEGNFSTDSKWIRHITYDERNVIKERAPECDPEPDFYYMVREKFSHLNIVIGYLVFFIILFFHLRHAFPSAFQTLGLNNYKYNCAIEVLGKIYTWIIVLGFTIVPIMIFINK